ncbi:MAG: radical SAM family heme chaperone HemW [Lachnospiraceae bacterium]|nr:radical SAM family heme chaperone HemW [Lachnospiraceae bacterium]
MKNNQAMELYIHIPFCKRKCNYCDFLSFSGKDYYYWSYLDALMRDIRRYGGHTVSTVYIGGGTPSAMPIGFYDKLFECIRENFFLQPDAEVTIEANPGTLTAAKAVEYKRAGINRMSLGLQSTIDEELQTLGRIHTYNDFLKSFEVARKAGISNINVDLMMGIPGQTEESFKTTLSRIALLHPEHISAYMLMVEDGTPFQELYRTQPSIFPDEETVGKLYEMAVAFLAKKGYSQYEISNFSRSGYACKHNIGYWKRIPYLGIGLGAASLIDDTRYRVTTDLSDYLKELSYESEEKLTMRDIKNETLMLGLRLKEGVSYSELKDEFGEGFAGYTIARLGRYVEEGFMEHDYDRFFFNTKGYLVSNSILSDLLE